MLRSTTVIYKNGDTEKKWTEIAGRLTHSKKEGPILTFMGLPVSHAGRATISHQHVLFVRDCPRVEVGGVDFFLIFFLQ